MANQRKVMLVQGMPAAGRVLLEARDDVLVEDCPNDEVDTLLDRMGDISAVTLRTTPCDRAFIEASPNLEVVARFGVGFDSVDMEALTERGIPLLIAGEANSRSVAEHAVYLMMALAKRSLYFPRHGPGTPFPGPVWNRPGQRRTLRKEAPRDRVRPDWHPNDCDRPGHGHERGRV